jgi:UDP-N-acetylmuramoyl-L-alanyl-D-glutamate--2,6-diaminopimelate ligase
LILFNDNIKQTSIAVINADDKYSKFFIKICKKNKIRILDYGKNAKHLKIIKIIKKTDTIETHLQLNHKIFCINFPCYASYQVYNQICAFLLVFGKKLNKKKIIDNLNMSDPNGRLEKIYDKNKIRVFIDYAHTPDALKQVLSTLSNGDGNLVIVFGCGGDRDIQKRPLMSKEAIKYCDYIFMTSDNPRTESPNKIFSDMTKTLKKNDLKKIEIIENRSKAICAAIDFIKSGDTLIIAGKGHEKYQIIDNKRIYFSDSEIATNKLLDK